MNKYGFVMLDESKAQELAQIAEEVGALAFRGHLQFPGPESGDWELNTDVIPDILHELRDREVLLILSPVRVGEPAHLCAVCGFVLSEPGEPCPRCALINEEVAAAIDGKRVAESVEAWLKDRAKPPTPHPIEEELAKIQQVLGALAECPPLAWADKLLWRGLRWFYRRRQRRVKAAWEELSRPDN
jgi:hypothetical protein